MRRKLVVKGSRHYQLSMRHDYRVYNNRRGIGLIAGGKIGGAGESTDGHGVRLSACVRRCIQREGNPDTMKQLQITQTDPEYVFTFAEVEQPVPGDRQVLVKMAATSINPSDWKFAGSDIAPLPHPVGLDVAGTVAGIGAKVEEFAVGDRVVAQASMRTGTFAPFTVTKAKTTAKLPDSVRFTDAATLPTSGQTAYAAIIEEAQVAEGQSVLIHGAAGGVGTLAVQLAKNRGARVFATASARNHDLLRQLGADQVIDYATTRFEDVVREVDVVIDTVGGDTFSRSMNVLRHGGTMVSIAFFGDPPEGVVESRHIDVRQISMRPSRDRLMDLGHLIAKGAVTPVIGAEMPLSAAIDAFHQSMNRHNQGNLVIRSFR